MGSLYLNRLSGQERDALIEKLMGIQKSKCFICDKEINLSLNKIEIDHVIPLAIEGKDDPSNLALAHSSCNESKQDADLRVARILAKFSSIKEACLTENRGANLDDVFHAYGGSKSNLPMVFDIAKNVLDYSIQRAGRIEKHSASVYLDKLSGFNCFFCVLPIEYLFHDDKINPRSIGQNISKLVKEFFLKRPQLHISLGWTEINDNNESFIKIFDGQHKAAAQVLLGIKELPVRVFINPDIDVLLATNTNAGTTLRQVAFDKSVQRHLGNTLYIDRVERYQRETNRDIEDISFSEKDLVNYYKGESREMKRYILDAIRDWITHHTDNKLKEFVDFGGRAKEKPLSYSTIEKTFYSFFIYQDVLETAINFKLEEGENPRTLEKEQILRLINLVAEEIFAGRFDLDLGTYRIENRIQKGEDIPEAHLAAYRLSHEEIIYNWLKYIRQIIRNFFIMQGKPINEEKLFQYRFPETIWQKIRIFLKNLRDLPLWVNRQLSQTIFGGKQNYEFWQQVFETGKTGQGFPVLLEPLDLMKMIKE